jgi:hypothetical protein
MRGGRPPDERRRSRQEHAAPRLADLRSWLDATLSELSGKNERAKAIRHGLSRWPALTRYADHGDLEIDNNAAERAIRPLAIGRKNWLFAGSDIGGEDGSVIVLAVMNFSEEHLGVVGRFLSSSNAETISPTRKELSGFSRL